MAAQRAAFIYTYYRGAKVMWDIKRVLNDTCGTQFTDEDEQEEYLAPCPFHYDTHPSFYMSNEGKFYCQACGTGGYWLVQYIMQLYGQSELQALDTLFPYTIGNEDVFVANDSLLSLAPPDRSDADTLPATHKIKAALLEERHQNNLRAACEYARGNFYNDPLAFTDWEHAQSPGMHSMFARGFLADTMQHFHVADWQRFPDHPIFIPLQCNDVIYGYQQRRIDKHVWPKFMTMMGMRKSDNVYGYAPVDMACVGSDVLGLVVEGMLDLMMAWQYGWRQETHAAFAILGSDVSCNQALMLASSCDRYLIATDMDSAGELAYHSFLKRMAPYTKAIQRVQLPAKDIALCTRAEFWQAIERVL